MRKVAPGKSRDEELWARVRYWRKRLAEGEHADLEEGWQRLDEMYGPVIWRAGDQKANTLLNAFTDYLDSDTYPPPEILLTIFECFNAYLKAGGELSLEEVFFGRPKRKGGTLAKRQRTHEQYVAWAAQLRVLREQGHSRTTAAEILSERLPGKPEPESILRLVSKHVGLKKNRRANS